LGRVTNFVGRPVGSGIGTARNSALGPTATHRSSAPPGSPFGIFHDPCLWPLNFLDAPWGESPSLSSALWRQYPAIYLNMPLKFSMCLFLRQGLACIRSAPD